jgi:cyclase
MSHTDVPVVVAGGIGSWRHMYEVLSGLGASGVATSNIYHLAPQSIRSAKDFLTSQGVKVRRSSEILIPESP